MNHGTRKILAGACAVVLVAAFWLTMAKGDSSTPNNQTSSPAVKKTVPADAGPAAGSVSKKLRPKTSEKRTLTRKTSADGVERVAIRKTPGRVHKRTPKATEAPVF